MALSIESTANAESDLDVRHVESHSAFLGRLDIEGFFLDLADRPTP